MYLIDVLDDGIVRANGFNLFRLTRPFGHLFDRRKNPDISKKRLTLSPSQSVNTKKIRRYSVYLDDKTVARLHCKYASGFKCHALYKTFATYKNAWAYRLFVSKALDYILVHLYDSDKVPDEVSKYIHRLIQLVFESYPFECVYTDCKRIKTVCDLLGIPVEYFEWYLDNVSDSCPVVLEGLLKVHNKIPLNILDDRVLGMLKVEQTNIDPSIFEGKKNYMLLTSMNNYFAGYFLDVCTKYFGGEEVLSVILFSI